MQKVYFNTIKIKTIQDFGRTQTIAMKLTVTQMYDMTIGKRCGRKELTSAAVF